MKTYVRSEKKKTANNFILEKEKSAEAVKEDIKAKDVSTLMKETTLFQITKKKITYRGII